MRTDWGHQARTTLGELHQDYRASMADFKTLIEAYVGHEVGDPERIASLIVTLASRATLPPRLLLGSDAFHVVEVEEKARGEAMQLWKPVSLAADFDSVLPEWPSE